MPYDIASSQAAIVMDESEIVVRLAKSAYCKGTLLLELATMSAFVCLYEWPPMCYFIATCNSWPPIPCYSANSWPYVHVYMHAKVLHCTAADGCVPGPLAFASPQHASMPACLPAATVLNVICSLVSG